MRKRKYMKNYTIRTHNNDNSNDNEIVIANILILIEACLNFSPRNGIFLAFHIHLIKLR